MGKKKSVTKKAAALVVFPGWVVNFYLNKHVMGGHITATFLKKPTHNEVYNAFQFLDVANDLNEEQRSRLLCGDFYMHEVAIISQQTAKETK